MKKTTIILWATILVSVVVSSTIDAQNRRSNRSASTNVNKDRPVTDCGDIQVRFDRQPAITEGNEMVLPASQVGTLRTQLTNGGMYVTGWDRNEYSVKTCKAVPDEPNATGTLREITTTNNGGQLAVNGPGDKEWMVHLIIMVPRLSRMDVETLNGPLQLRELAGVLRLTAKNGPVSLYNVGGVVDTTATNGPISLSGASGDQRVTATNGPIQIELSGSRWDGPGLDVSAKNGPLSVSIPNAYGSSIQMRTSDNSPMNCVASICAGAKRTSTSPNIIRFGNGDPIVRLSTENGPVRVLEAKN
jgi:hypothetical protein